MKGKKFLHCRVVFGSWWGSKLQSKYGPGTKACMRLVLAQTGAGTQL